MESIHKQLNDIKELLIDQNIQKKQILTLAETSKYLQLSKSCIYKMTSRKEIPHYSPGGKIIYFKKQDLDEWIFKSRIPASYELESEIEEFLEKANHKKHD